jgi:deoxyribodipyrimidine photolyase-related protein
MAFLRELRAASPGEEGRRWLYVPYDQLSSDLGPLVREAPDNLGIILIESRAKAGRRPYHKQKLALVLANQRHFALEQARRGVAVRYGFTEGTYREALTPLIDELGPIAVMEPAERELRRDLQGLVGMGLEILPHEGWLTEASDLGDGPPWRMDRFYRTVRRRTGILMEHDKPLGGRFSFDAENRKPWRGEPEPPSPPTFPVTPIKTEVGALIEREFGDHPGRLDLEHLPATAEDAEQLWSWARTHCLPNFGPFEDAMSTRSRNLFHTRISSLLNLHRLLPQRVLTDVLEADIETPSKEGFVRQLLGWREFVRHVHDATDGFRETARNYLEADRDLPPAYWGKAPSGLACLDAVVDDVWDEAYSHHITRLMVLSNIATLLDTHPRTLTDWFWVAYADAYEWVVEPNVMGMGTFATGDVMTTKPYISGAGYIHRMSDYCAACQFHPKKDCPLTRLYWAFLARHENRLGDNPRMRPVFASLRKRDKKKRAIDGAVFETVTRRLAQSRTVLREEVPN